MSNKAKVTGKIRRWLITGGTGFIGASLARRLLMEGDQVTILSRTPQKAAKTFTTCPTQPICISDLSTISSQEKFDHIINLAGEPLFGGLWTKARRAAFYTSRIETTQKLITLLNRLEHKPESMISGSAIGYYGMDPLKTFEEDAPAGSDDMAELCMQWETAAAPAAEAGVRLVLIRTGLVLHESGGMLAPLSQSAKLGLGAKIGTGTQWMSWISLHDMVELIITCATEATYEGAVNATAPYPVQQEDFINKLATHYGRPRFLSVPSLFLKALGGMSDLLLQGQKVVPSKAQKNGFIFSHPALEDAFKAAKADESPL